MMRGAFRVGRMFGIDVVVDSSWALFFVLMSWNLTAVFHKWHPTWMLGASFFLAVVATLLFVASVLAHEFAHALVAKAFGMEVREIRLFLFGGISNIEREPPSPVAEFSMAVVGPLLSIALGIVFVVIATLTDSHSFGEGADPWQTLAGFSPLSTLFYWLGPINLMVAVFNLIPGFPLDGGRILRAALWKISGDRHLATFAASVVGRAIGWGFVLFGIAMVFGARTPFFGQGAASGLWLAFVGWFLSSAAGRSFSALVVAEPSSRTA